MKTKYLIMLIALISLFVISCSKVTDDEVYSCDPMVNKWAHENTKKLQTISRSEIIKLTIVQQKAAWNTMSSENKYELWKDKYEELIKLDWNNEERSHLDLLMTFLDKKYFEEPSSIEIIEHQNQINSLLESWLQYSQEQLGWSKALLFSIGGRLDNPIINNKLSSTSKSNYSDESGGGGTNPACECNSSDPGNDFCGGHDMLYCKYHANGCDEVPSGCGWWWSHKCDGWCWPKADPDM